ncbi:hypothetical protein JCM3774_002872 [Rhodotorula dairenensis]
MNAGAWKRPFFAPDSSLGGTSSTSSGSDNGLVPPGSPESLSEEPKASKECAPEGDEDLVDVVVVDQLMKSGDELPPSTNGGRRPSTSAANCTDDAKTGRPCWSDNELAHGGRKRLQWAWRIVSVFFWPSFGDAKAEAGYQKEAWYNQKGAHIFGAVYLTLVWVLVLALLPRPLSTWDRVQLYALQPATTVPMIPLAFLDFPRRCPTAWQLLVYLSVWLFASANPIDMYHCDFFIDETNSRCSGKDFQATLFYASAMPVVALFALGQHRLFMLLFMASWVALLGATILRQHQPYIHIMMNELIFLGFITFLHYLREATDRRMYAMRAELKAAYRAQQRAQVGERKQIDARERFTNYIFHEVRVPLNSALLAVQNIKSAADYADQPDRECAADFVALDSSLQLMSQVLNDVLDHSSLERGVFSSVQHPFSLHKIMQSIVIPLKLETAARGLTFDPAFDKRVDKVAFTVAHPDGKLSDVREGDGVVIGDEVRLRQIIGNLASNACKFTPAGGTIRLRTTLAYPIPHEEPSSAPPQLTEESVAVSEKNEPQGSLTPKKLEEHALKDPEPSKKMLVVRFEVTDTGVGIRRSDMAENRLFSPYVQTAVGREQGGKGTGLGLSLIRQIVALMGGRLGVRSQVGRGTTVWVELAFPIATGVAATTPDLESSLQQSKLFSPGVASSLATSHRHVGFSPTSTPLALEPGPVHQPDDASTAPSPFFAAPTSPTPPLASSPSGSISAAPAASSTGAAVSASEAESSRQRAPVTDTPTTTVSPSVLSIPSPDLQASSASAHVRSPGSDLASPPASSSASASQVPLTTPRPRTAPAGKAAVPSRKLDIEGPPLKVLIVDDDLLTRRLMSRMMSRLGCEVETAENGKIALDLILRPPPPDATEYSDLGLGVLTEESESTSSGSHLDRDVDAAERGAATIVHPPSKACQKSPAGIDAFHHYDVVFLDNQMPVCTGVEVVTKLRSLGRDDLVIGVTANALQSDQEQYLESGASFILTKPVKEDSFIRYLRLADKRRTGRADPAQQVQRQATSSSQFPHSRA